MQEPKTRGGRKPIILDSFSQSLLRRIVLNFYCRGEIPNLEKIHREAQDANDFPKMGLETLRKWLHKLGYAVRKRSMKRKVYERMGVVAARHKFLQNIRKYRSLGYTTCIKMKRGVMRTTHNSTYG